MVNRESMVRMTGVLDALGIAYSRWYYKPVPSPERRRPGPAAQPLSDDEVEGFRRRARELSQQEDGDQACFYLLKPREAQAEIAFQAAPGRKRPFGG